MNIDKQKIELAAAVAPILAPVARVTVNEKMQERQMRKKKEAEIELIETKRSVSGGQPVGGLQTGAAGGSQQTEAVQRQSDGEFEQSIERLIADEDCDLCKRLLEGIKDVEPSKRAQVLSEYGRFKQSTADTDDVDVIREEIEKMDVLRDVMVREFNMAPS